MKELFLAGALATLLAGSAIADDKVVKIGVLNDQTSLYADVAGPGSVLAAQMAVEDSGLRAKGWTIEVLVGDHQNKPDVGVGIARRWFDENKLDAVVDVPNSGVALAVSQVVREKNGVFLVSGAVSSELTNTKCSPNTEHWIVDTYGLAHGTGGAVVAQGGDTWFFVAADYAFGKQLQRDTTGVVEAAGGKVVGSVSAPLNTPDFSSYLLQAQSSKAKVIGLANAGGDVTNSIKQAHEFGIVAKGQKLAALLLFIRDVNALGLEVAQGLQFTTTFYWDRNDASRAFGKRFAERNKTYAMPTMAQAAAYSAVRSYLKTLEAAGGNSHDGAKIVAAMKATSFDDPLLGEVTIRADGRVLFPVYLYEVKTPEESKYPWDYYKLVATVPPEKAVRPLVRERVPVGEEMRLYASSRARGGSSPVLGGSSPAPSSHATSAPGRNRAERSRK